MCFNYFLWGTYMHRCTFVALHTYNLHSTLIKGFIKSIFNKRLLMIDVDHIVSIEYIILSSWNYIMSYFFQNHDYYIIETQYFYCIGHIYVLNLRINLFINWIFMLAWRCALATESNPLKTRGAKTVYVKYICCMYD